MEKLRCIPLVALLTLAHIGSASAQDRPQPAPEEEPPDRVPIDNKPEPVGDASAPADTTPNTNKPAHHQVPPWAKGVTEEQKQRAKELHQQGIKAAKELFYSDALKHYLAALKYWDHPMIRYNTAFVLIKLSRIIEAREHLLQAIRHGEAPLGAEVLQNALTRLELVNKQLAEVEIRSDDAHIEITLDGEPILKGDGKATKIVTPGNHQLVAKTPSLPTLVYRVPIWADQRHTITVDPARALTRRWDSWKPWFVFGAGGVVLGGGGLLYWRAQSNFNEYDRLVLETCPDGCAEAELSDKAKSLRRWATWQNRFAGVFYTIGALTLLSGTAMLVWNRPRQVDDNAFGVEVTPLLSPVGGGITASGRF